MARVRFSSLFASHTSLLDLTALYALCVNSSTVSGPALIALELSVCLEFAPIIERFACIPYSHRLAHQTTDTTLFYKHD